MKHLASLLIALVLTSPALATLTRHLPFNDNAASTTVVAAVGANAAIVTANTDAIVGGIIRRGRGGAVGAIVGAILGPLIWILGVVLLWPGV